MRRQEHHHERGGPPCWQSVACAPRDEAVEVAVIDHAGAHPLVVPCRRTADGWLDATTSRRIDINPTHWRPWPRHAPAPH